MTSADSEIRHGPGRIGLRRPLGSQSSSDRAYGYQRRSRPSRSCRRPAVTRLPSDNLRRAGLGAQRGPRRGQQLGGIRIVRGRVPSGAQLTPARRGRPAARPAPGGRGPVRAPRCAPRAPRTRACPARGRPGEPGRRPGRGSARRRRTGPHAISHARLAASAASSTRSSRRPDRHGGGSTGSAAGDPGRPGGSGTAGIGAEEPVRRTPSWRPRPHRPAGRPPATGVTRRRRHWPPPRLRR